MLEDLRWLGLTWEEPIVAQSQRLPIYRAALARLHAAGHIFPCMRTRRDVLDAIGAPHEVHLPGQGGENDEPVYPPQFRPAPGTPLPPLADALNVNWRFRVPDGATLTFDDAALGPQSAVAGRDFGDFLVWRKDGVPSYQLSCAVDDADLAITEVVRGADLVKSTFRQLIIIRALEAPAPHYYHAPLMLDAAGVRLAKRHDALSLRTLRERGTRPEEIIAQFASTPAPEIHG